MFTCIFFFESVIIDFIEYEASAKKEKKNDLDLNF